MLPDSFKLSDLCCGHEGKYICSLKGRFDPRLVNEPIQLGQLSCGCWIVLDGNNRIGLILKHDIEAKIGEFPKNIFSLLKNGTLAEEEIYYWTPYPKTFGYILSLSKQLNILIPSGSIPRRLRRNIKGWANIYINTPSACGGVVYLETKNHLQVKRITKTR